MQELTPTSVYFYIGLALKPQSNGGAGNGSSGGHKGGDGGSGGRLIGAAGRRIAGDEGGEVEVVFPSLRPRLALLRQVYQQLQPLLECDLAARQGEAGARELGTGTPPPTPAD